MPVSYAITRVSLTRIGYNAIDQYVNAVCITRTFASSCWLLRDFSDLFEDISLDGGPHFFFLSRSHSKATIAL
jgi:stage V sporulation protein SpoVS